MDWFSDIKWFVVHARRFREKLAASSVSALGAETFLPLVKLECPERAVIRVGSKPLFSGYLFARFAPAALLDAVESARGVLYVVKFGSLPIPVETQVICEIQERVEADGLIRLRRVELRPGDRVSIQDGPFAGMMGRVESELDDRKRVAILLEALWHVRVVLEKRWVEAEAA